MKSKSKEKKSKKVSESSSGRSGRNQPKGKGKENESDEKKRRKKRRRSKSRERDKKKRAKSRGKSRRSRNKDDLDSSSSGEEEEERGRRKKKRRSKSRSRSKSKSREKSRERSKSRSKSREKKRKQRRGSRKSSKADSSDDSDEDRSEKKIKRKVKKRIIQPPTQPVGLNPVRHYIQQPKFHTGYEGTHFPIRQQQPPQRMSIEEELGQLYESINSNSPRGRRGVTQNNPLYAPQRITNNDMSNVGRRSISLGNEQRQQQQQQQHSLQKRTVTEVFQDELLKLLSEEMNTFVDYFDNNGQPVDARKFEVTLKKIELFEKRMFRKFYRKIKKLKELNDDLLQKKEEVNKKMIESENVIKQFDEKKKIMEEFEKRAAQFDIEKSEFERNKKNIFQNFHREDQDRYEMTDQKLQIAEEHINGLNKEIEGNKEKKAQYKKLFEALKMEREKDFETLKNYQKENEKLINYIRENARVQKKMKNEFMDQESKTKDTNVKLTQLKTENLKLSGQISLLSNHLDKKNQALSDRAETIDGQLNDMNEKIMGLKKVNKTLATSYQSVIERTMEIRQRNEQLLAMNRQSEQSGDALLKKNILLEKKASSLASREDTETMKIEPLMKRNGELLELSQLLDNKIRTLMEKDAERKRTVEKMQEEMSLIKRKALVSIVKLKKRFSKSQNYFIYLLDLFEKKNEEIHVEKENLKLITSNLQKKNNEIATLLNQTMEKLTMKVQKLKREKTVLQMENQKLQSTSKLQEKRSEKLDQLVKKARVEMENSQLQYENQVQALNSDRVSLGKKESDLMSKNLSLSNDLSKSRARYDKLSQQNKQLLKKIKENLKITARLREENIRMRKSTIDSESILQTL